ncbi:hypothetical protein [Terracoccus luteus]|uniref:Uncharacterized protein n=1 Tax=Terracoccus luteus TaxID=53356 RepID=A0A839Q1V2_9MICO|nr:hypothetical protein [Terracoccus luteus]MBB2988295.1 hypothetical protein [Terracoccus luteus]MCP2173930.1 hypothetical protein [Terracoccus luteus]
MSPLTRPSHLPPSPPRSRAALAGTAAVAACAVAATLAGAPASATPASGAVAPATAATVTGARAPLTNLAHLDFLGDRVTPPRQPGHTTYRAAADPSFGVLWTYAEPDGDSGAYTRIGGGTYDPATDTYTQGAFNADDVSRAAVVYLRHWQQTGSATSRDRAFEMLRGLAYFQTVSGRDAGNVVLWMQPDGTLNRSAEPVELPDPSDSDASFWLARTVWAFGEGYAAFKDADPAFARFLRDRLDLSVAALDRQVLDQYGRYLQIDGRRTPAWLVNDGTDATAEAVLGLAAYVEAGGPATARRALARFAEGMTALQAGDTRSWPFEAVQQWGLSRSVWHAWASQQPAALSRAGDVLSRDALVRVAERESGTFDPWLLTTTGAVNGMLPVPLERNQIAYGVDSRVQSLTETADAVANGLDADAAGSRGLRALAGMEAAWYFGANASEQPAYDPTTGRTVDGIEADGRVNRNAGAESTIHGLLSMLVLDAHPDIAAVARNGRLVARSQLGVLEGEDAATTGAAEVVTPSSLWTGEASYSGRGYVALGAGSTATMRLPDGPSRIVMAVVDLQPGSTAVTTFSAGGWVLGQVRAGAVGPQGASEALGALLPVTLRLPVPDGAITLTATTTADGSDTTRLDAVVLQPEVTRAVIEGAGAPIALVRNAGGSSVATAVSLPGAGVARVERYDGLGRPLGQDTATGSTPTVRVAAGGFTVVRR